MPDLALFSAWRATGMPRGKEKTVRNLYSEENAYVIFCGYWTFIGVTTPRGGVRRGLLRKRFTYWWTLAPEGGAPALNKMFLAALTSRSATNPQEGQM